MVDDRIGYQLKRAQHALRLAMDAALHDLALTTAQYSALSALEASPGLSNAALARYCFVTPQTMHVIVQQLEARSLVARTQHPEHGRILQTSLAAAGTERLAQAHQIVNRVEAQMIVGLDAEERRRLAQWLAQCSQALATM